MKQASSRTASQTFNLLMIGVVTTAAMVIGVPAARGAAGWYQVNDDGFSYPASGSANSSTQLFEFDGRLYASNENGLFQMSEHPLGASGAICVEWTSLSIPGSSVRSLIALDGYLYLFDGGSKQLWFVAAGSDPASATWTQVTSTGTPGAVSPIPETLFGGKLYGVRPTMSSFEIWRSPDVGAATMVWTKVTSEGLGDPQNNRVVAFMREFDNRLVIATQTLKGMFGLASAYATGGVEVWASTNRDASSFVQINSDGFGTHYPSCVGSVCNFPVNQMIGAHAEYQGQLYVGTKGHFGAEVWRYDGSGWTNVSQPWSCIGCLTTMKHLRNEAITVQGGLLYLAAGYPSSDLATFDGSSWSILESGPAPFDSMNNGLYSLATLNGRVYVASKRSGAATTGTQVWSGPYRTPPSLCEFADSWLPDLRFDPPLFNWVFPAQLLELRIRVANVGQAPANLGIPVQVVVDDRMVDAMEIPWLEAGERREIELALELGEGQHRLSLVIDPEGQLEDAAPANNALHMLISPPAEEVEAP